MAVDYSLVVEQIVEEEPEVVSTDSVWALKMVLAHIC